MNPRSYPVPCAGSQDSLVAFRREANSVARRAACDFDFAGCSRSSCEERPRSHVFWSYFAATGVHIFFVISGYLITTLLMREHDLTFTISLREFYARRAFRIFPAALVFMAVTSIAYWHDLPCPGTTCLERFFYLANYDLTRPWIFGHLWSLSIEEQFYLLWPFVLKKWYRHRMSILVGVMVFPCGRWLLIC